MSFLAITVVPVALLAWLTWRIFEQDGALANQTVRDRLEGSADGVVAALERDLGELEDQLTSPRLTLNTESAVIVRFTPGATTVIPPGRLSYYPAILSPSADLRDVFGPGEDLEFRQRDYPRARQVFRELARSANVDVRGEALVRLARVERKGNRPDAALAAYRSLGQLTNATIAGVPAELVALDARCALLAELKRTDDLRREAALMVAGLSQGRWPLDRASYYLYADRAHHWLGGRDDTGDESDGPVLADAVDALWHEWRDTPRSPADTALRLTRWVRGIPVLVLWRARDDTLSVLVAHHGFMEARHAGVWAAQQVRVALLDREGRQVLGPDVVPNLPVAVRTGGETRLPWTVRVTSMNAGAELAQLAGRRSLLLSVLGITALLTMVGGYLTARATARELAVARLQSDFVAAVSHEFRTPLTSLRHLTDLLERDAVDSEERRRQYFAVLSSETERLHRMVEGLLEFGRVAAGRREYEFESVDPRELLEGIVSDFRHAIEGSGRRIELSSRLSPGTRHVRVDREALSRAIRNLLENAVKYSPADAPVFVDVTDDDGRVAIAIRDDGTGIPAAEQSSIFEQFVRGSSARTLNVKGTGIGLSMVRHIVLAHGGEIRLTSKPGQGSTFTVLLREAGSSNEGTTRRSRS